MKGELREICTTQEELKEDKNSFSETFVSGVCCWFCWKHQFCVWFLLFLGTFTGTFHNLFAMLFGNTMFIRLLLFCLEQTDFSFGACAFSETPDLNFARAFHYT